MDSSRLTSLSLVEGLQSNDARYWTRLNTLYGPIIDYWIKKAGVPISSQEDVRQEVLLAIVRGIENYAHSSEEVGSLRRWMWGIARNKIVDFQRKEFERAIASGGTHALARLKELPSDPYEDSDPDTLTRLRKELVARALSILETDFEQSTWKAFWQTVVEEQSTAEAAQALGMSVQAVRQARHRVLLRLREELGSQP